MINRPYNAVMLMKEDGEPLVILESKVQSKRILKKWIQHDFNYYNNREGYGAVKLKFYTTKGGTYND